MPFYEYECANCRFYSEVMQKISDPPMKRCPSCGKNTMKKLVSAPVFRLKGGGWYETDFKSDKEAKRNLAVDKPPESAPAEGAKADAKPDATPDAKPAEAKPTESKPAAAKSHASRRRPAKKAKARPRPARKGRR
jgi:putative FmdB family regulatory protein